MESIEPRFPMCVRLICTCNECDSKILFLVCNFTDNAAESKVLLYFNLSRRSDDYNFWIASSPEKKMQWDQSAPVHGQVRSPTFECSIVRSHDGQFCFNGSGINLSC